MRVAVLRRAEHGAAPGRPVRVPSSEESGAPSAGHTIILVILVIMVIVVEQTVNSAG